MRVPLHHGKVRSLVFGKIGLSKKPGSLIFLFINPLPISPKNNMRFYGKEMTMHRALMTFSEKWNRTCIKFSIVFCLAVTGGALFVPIAKDIACARRHCM